MNLEPKNLSYYEWDDLEAYFCDQLGIPNDKFRDYHEFVGGEYLDLWNVWIDITENSVINGHIVGYYRCELLDIFSDQEIKKEFNEDRRLDKFREIISDLFNDNTKTYVEYSW